MISEFSAKLGGKRILTAMNTNKRTEKIGEAGDEVHVVIKMIAFHGASLVKLVHLLIKSQILPQ